MSFRLVLAPGRGSYAKGELGSLRRLAEAAGSDGKGLLATLEAMRRELDPDLPSLAELDGAKAFKPSLHLPGRNASPLIFACGLLHAEALRAEGRGPDLVGGNSLGFYTALVLAGALEPEQGYRLVSTMARLQEQGPAGGQVLWTLLDDDWNVVPGRAELVQELCALPDLDLSIRLGGHVVLAGTEEALATALERLPEVKVGERSFPFRLPFHGPFHTPLLLPVAQAALDELADLPLGRPRIPLLDGRGAEWSPLSTDPVSLLAYTLGAQVTRTFDFTRMVEVALSDFAPDEVVLLEPGTSLRAPVGHVERWLASPPTGSTAG
ncbi:MAG: ACP S-malonyltransferase [Planctomycetota bacterium]